VSAALASVALLGAAGAVAGVLLGPRVRVVVAALLSAASSAVALVASARILAGAAPATLHLPGVVPLGGVTLRLDAFGAVISGVGALVALTAALYWIGYGGALSSRTSAAALPTFAATLLLVPTAANVTTFMALWELMALTSLVLVMSDHRRAAARSAARWYAAMTQGGAAFVLGALVLLGAHAHSQEFAAIARAAPALSPALRASVLVLAALGFAAKAGVVPFHVWLPKAHAEAPGPVSALMSGAMVNLGLYGLALVGWRLAGPAPPWWWTALAALGVLSALYGALFSATSTDLKRLLAYSTTDNVGLILLALALAGLLQTRPLAGLALAVALVVMASHAAFKSLLFLTAGSIQRATHLRDLDRLGGLMTRLPLTATLFLVGAWSVAALPPLSGFSGEWLLFQSLLRAGEHGGSLVVVVVLAGVGALALTGGLTLVAFVKAAGIGLLGRARSDEARAATEVAAPMAWSPAVPALATLMLGLFAPEALHLGARGAEVLLGRAVASGPSGGVTLRLGSAHGTLAPALLALGLAISVAAIVLARRLANAGLGEARRRAFEPWGSGRRVQTPRMQYTATSFAEPLQRVFDDVLRPERDVEVSHASESRYVITRITVETSADDLVERTLYRPAVAALRRYGVRMRALQNGSVHRYLAYGLAVLIVVLAVVR
jgi:hydrogenase-4 component B